MLKTLATCCNLLGSLWRGALCQCKTGADRNQAGLSALSVVGFRVCAGAECIFIIFIHGKMQVSATSLLHLYPCSFDVESFGEILVIR
jgi:hypothetical protein